MNNESSEANLDEKAIRAQLDAHLEKAGAASLGPDEAPPPRRPSRRGGQGGGHGGHGSHQEPQHLAKGTVSGVDGNKVLIELGPKSHGEISVEEFDEAPKPGDVFEFSLVSITDGVWSLSRKEARTIATWNELEKGRLVKATVIGENSGGLELKVGPVSAFMPASEIDVKRVETFADLVGQTWVCEVIEVAPKRKRVVLSRRAVLMRERREARDRSFEALGVGQVVKGKVEKLEPFGAFVDIGNGVTGLLHVSNISHQRVADPSKVLVLGQELEVQILEVSGKKVGLGLKQLSADPWETAAARLKPGGVIEGKVVRIAEFGAFVEVEPGIEGLLHRSQVSSDRNAKLSDFVKVGQSVKVRVVGVEPGKKRISLSMLSDRGHVIGSEDDIGSADLDPFLSKGQSGSSGTNLGALLREAMAKKSSR
jgi:ribosomal protein S1